ncbi:Uncharacterized protein DAT39_009770 [Clarias magur]|uniref:Uncharacterized protein n=1 Tax=Clarias magur TaxID=1594786 RepID=A0A8J4X1X4_CLAMG|nr:Uncharacterized protein DAT39_009770 [Clarias magur]
MALKQLPSFPSSRSKQEVLPERHKSLQITTQHQDPRKKPLKLLTLRSSNRRHRFCALTCHSARGSSSPWSVSLALL